MRNIAHPRRAETIESAQQWLGMQPDSLFFRRHAHFVTRPPQPGAIENHGACNGHPLHGSGEQWRRQARMQGQPQLLLAHALQIRPLGMEGIERRDGGPAESLPGCAVHGDRLVPARKHDEIVELDCPACSVGRGGAVAEKCIEVDKTARPVQRSCEGSRRIRGVQRQQLRAAFRRATLALRRAQVD
ncbi:MAG TPA: hypothetical protein VLB05_04030 [Dongiaceae bacterium]|nr:hypothetical protein [Dongiaceae bacterium]